MAREPITLAAAPKERAGEKLSRSKAEAFGRKAAKADVSLEQTAKLIALMAVEILQQCQEEKHNPD